MLIRLSVVLALASLAAANALAQSASQYAIKQPDPPLGSNTKRNLTEGSRIPINKTYSEMSPEEKEAVHWYYDKIDFGDEPPFPTEGLRPVHGAVAKAQQTLLVTGELVLVASVGPDGNVTEVKAIGARSREMVRAAAPIVALTKFKPALCKGQPCTMDFPFVFNFKVQ